MTFNKMVKAICELEGLKSQTAIGNVREILKVQKTLCKDRDFFMSFIDYLVGYKRAKVKKVR